MKRTLAALASCALALFAAPAAHADSVDRAATAICQDLTANPVDGQVEYDLSILVEMGLTVEQAVKFMVVAVKEYCPENLIVLKHYADGPSSRNV